MSGVVGRVPPRVGVCKTCLAEFRSTDDRGFCSLACYSASPEANQRLRDAVGTNLRWRRERLAAMPKSLDHKCDECGKEFSVKRLCDRRRFCCTLCYRTWYKNRFDRWIANPQTIALPQNYDEYFSGKEMMCPVAGCRWFGRNLGAHADKSHGIPVGEMKRILGCNKSTPLVTPDVSDKLSLIAHERDLPSLGVQWKPGESGVRTEGIGNRLEAREHRRKSRMIRDLSEKPAIEHTCEGCREKFTSEHTYSRYCTKRCRDRFYQTVKFKDFDLTCANCGRQFKGRGEQRRNPSACCGIQCRNERNAKLKARAVV